MAANPKTQHYTFDEYLALEQTQQQRYEYWHGELFAMAGGTRRHNRLVGNTRRLLEDGVLGRPCEVYAENVKLALAQANIFVYPDVMLTCEPADMEASDLETYIRYPSLLVEVLSDGTAKQLLYFKIPTLQYYILIHQDSPTVELYERHENFWKFSILETLDATVSLPKLAYTFSLAQVYEGVRF